MHPRHTDTGCTDTEGDGIESIDIQTNDFGAQPIVSAGADRGARITQTEKREDHGGDSAGDDRSVKFSLIEQQIAYDNRFEQAIEVNDAGIGPDMISRMLVITTASASSSKN